MVLSAQAMACAVEMTVRRSGSVVISTFLHSPFWGLLCDCQKKTSCPSDRMFLYGKNKGSPFPL